MATYYAPTAGVANWAAAQWATLPNQGSGSSGPPTANDDVVLEQYGGNVSIASSASVVCRSLDCTGYIHTLTGGASSTVTIGTSTAPASNNALVFSTTMTYTPGTAGTIVFASTYTATPQKIDYGNKTVGPQTWSGAGSWLFVNHGCTPLVVTTPFSHTAGTLNTNGINFTTGYFSSTGATARTLTLGSSRITCTGTTNGFAVSGSNLVLSTNTAVVVINSTTNSSFGCAAGATQNWNGLSVHIQQIGAGNTLNITGGSNTLANLRTNSNLTGTGAKYISPDAGSTTTITGTLATYGNYNTYWLFCAYAAGTATISLPAGNHYLRACRAFVSGSKLAVFSGTGVAKVPPWCTVASSGAVIDSTCVNTYYMDYTSGLDATSETPLGWWSIAYTGATGTCPITDETITGGTSSSTAKVSFVNPGEWAAGSGILYLYGKSAAFQAEALTGGTGGGTCTIAGNLTYCAWKTMTSGPTTTRCGAGEIIRIAKSSTPISIGNASWVGTGVPYAGTTNNIASSTTNTPIVVTSNGHGLVPGDWVQITGHTTNTNANGLFRISASDANTFTLQNSVGNGTGSTTGYWQKANSKIVTLAGTRTTLISECETTAWSALNSGSPAMTIISSSGGDGKSGYGCVSITSAAVAAGVQQAYVNTGTLNLSGYNAITLWIKQTTALTATQWVIQLCTGTGGGTVVDTFIVPANAQSSTWMPVTLTRVGGGSLHDGIQSIAVAAGSSGLGAGVVLRLDNINACNVNDLNLTSLITKNSTEQGGTDCYYPIQSINDVYVTLDNYSNAILANAGWGYWGVTDAAAATYIRQTTPTTPVTTTATTQAFQQAGLAGYPTQYQGGYSTSANTQTGETIYDGQNGCGYGIYYSNVAHSLMNHVSVTRYNLGITYNTMQEGWTLSNVMCGCACSAGISMADAAIHGMMFKNIRGVNGNAFGISVPRNSIVDYMEVLGCGTVANTINGITLYNNVYVTNGLVSCNNHGITTNGYGISLNGGNIVVNSLVTNNNHLGSITDAAGFNQNNYVRNALLGEGAPTGFADMQNAWLYMWQYGQSAVDHRNYTDGGAFVSTQAAGKRHTASGLAWMLTPQSTRVNNASTFYPLDVELAEIAVNANTLVTITCWVMVDSLTAITGQILIKGGQLAGVNGGTVNGIVQDLTSTCTSTSYQLLTLTFTPTQSGVVTLTGRAWYNTGVSNVYYDDISVSQV